MYVQKADSFCFAFMYCIEFLVFQKKKKCRVTYNIGHVALGRVKVILPSHCQSITFQLAQKVERLPCKGSNTWFCA